MFEERYCNAADEHCTAHGPARVTVTVTGSFDVCFLTTKAAELFQKGDIQSLEIVQAQLSSV